MPSPFAVCVGRFPLTTLWVFGWLLWIVSPPGLVHGGDAITPAPSPVVTAQHWAFQPVRRPSFPSTIRERWVQRPIDAFILAALQQHHIAPAAAADRRTLLRRATYDLLGLPPTPEELDRFSRTPRRMRLPERWTYRYAGRDFRLKDVSGQVVRGVLA